jgi:hypothetical protein
MPNEYALSFPNLSSFKLVVSCPKIKSEKPVRLSNRSLVFKMTNPKHQIRNGSMGRELAERLTILSEVEEQHLMIKSFLVEV